MTNWPLRYDEPSCSVSRALAEAGEGEADVAEREESRAGKVLWSVAAVNCGVCCVSSDAAPRRGGTASAVM